MRVIFLFALVLLVSGYENTGEEVEEYEGDPGPYHKEAEEPEEYLAEEEHDEYTNDEFTPFARAAAPISSTDEYKEQDVLLSNMKKDMDYSQDDYQTNYDNYDRPSYPYSGGFDRPGGLPSDYNPMEDYMQPLYDMPPHGGPGHGGPGHGGPGHGGPGHGAGHGGAGHGGPGFGGPGFGGPGQGPSGPGGNFPYPGIGPYDGPGKRPKKGDKNIGYDRPPYDSQGHYDMPPYMGHGGPTQLPNKGKKSDYDLKKPKKAAGHDDVPSFDMPPFGAGNDHGQHPWDMPPFDPSNMPPFDPKDMPQGPWPLPPYPGFPPHCPNKCDLDLYKKCTCLSPAAYTKDGRGNCNVGASKFDLRVWCYVDPKHGNPEAICPDALPSKSKKGYYWSRIACITG